MYTLQSDGNLLDVIAVSFFFFFPLLFPLRFLAKNEEILGVGYLDRRYFIAQLEQTLRCLYSYSGAGRARKSCRAQSDREHNVFCPLFCLAKNATLRTKVVKRPQCRNVGCRTFSSAAQNCDPWVAPTPSNAPLITDMMVQWRKTIARGRGVQVSWFSLSTIPDWDFLLILYSYWKRQQK